MDREAAKKVFLVARPLRGGGELASMKKITFFEALKKIPKNMWPLSSMGGGVKVFVAGPLKKLFLRLPSNIKQGYFFLLNQYNMAQYAPPIR